MEKGLRQGCPISALLFIILATYVAEAIKSCRIGVTVGDEKIPALFYADDIVLLAESEGELAIELGALTEAIRGLGLKLNYKRSKVMKMGACTQATTEWVITDRQYKTEGIIEETNEYKYLGITIGRSNGMKQHTVRLPNTIRRRIGYRGSLVCVVAWSREKFN